MSIMNVNARFPGSVHDAFIWKSSNVRKALQIWQIHNRKSHTWLLGDSGYPLEPWLMTPLAAASNQSEISYNIHLTKAQTIIEQCNGLLKNRWQYLMKHRVLHYHPEAASNIIIACVVLHNMCIKNNIILDEEVSHLEEDSQDVFLQNEENHPLLSEARHIQHLIRLCFS